MSLTIFYFVQQPKDDPVDSDVSLHLNLQTICRLNYDPSALVQAEDGDGDGKDVDADDDIKSDTMEDDDASVNDDVHV